MLEEAGHCIRPGARLQSYAPAQSGSERLRAGRSGAEGARGRWFFLRAGHAIRARSFASDEPEYGWLPGWVKPGDWVLDIGANVGHYTFRLSHLVGPTGRVIALEPVLDTLELLAANAAKFTCGNVTLLNAAASDTTRIVAMTLPSFSSGLRNYHMAGISSGAKGELSAPSIAVDSLDLPHKVSLIKLDVEGHELQTLKELRGLLARDRPALIAEGNAADVERELSDLGYRFEQTPGSPNRVFFA